MEVVTFELTGLSPLIQHSAASMMNKPEGSIGKKNIPSAEIEAEAGAYRMPSKQLYCPAQAVFACVLNACKGRRIGKIALNTIVVSSVFPTQEFVPLVHPKSHKPLTEYEIDQRRVMIQRAGIIRSRPKIPEWQGKITFEYDNEAIKSDALLEIVNLAGSRVGLLELSPRTKAGQYGRFQAQIVKN